MIKVENEPLPKACNNIPRRLGWCSRTVLPLLLLLILCATSEVLVRAYWQVRRSVPFREPDLILYAYYPELRRVDKTGPARGDEYYNILLLGGSALTRLFSTVEVELREQLAYAGYHKVRIFNLAAPAHTSRDSLLKYASLVEARFELVVFYHGINEARANNVPPERFHENYSHYSWYEIVNVLAPYHKTSSFALPYTLHFLTIRIRQTLNRNHYVPTHRPRPEWVQYGRNYRSKLSFEQNLNAILQFASQRGDQVLLMTFATYLPPDYSHDAFKDKRLDYLLHLLPIEQWGARENVVAAVAAHNEVVRYLATKNEDVLFVDQASLMKGSASYFNDPCHFTTAGSSKFVENLVKSLPLSGVK
jgi:hypothetical protein